MCDAIGFQVKFAPNQKLPDGYGVENERDADGGSCYYGYLKDLSWFGDVRDNRWDARRDVIAHFTESA